MSDRSDSISPPPPDEIIDQQAEESANASTSMPPPKSKGKAKQKSTDAGASRSKGTTILPAARVSRIIKVSRLYRLLKDRGREKGESLEGRR